MDDHQLIRLAIEQSRLAIDEGNYPYGAVLAHKGQVILSGRNSVVTGRDITWHAELGLLREACRTFKPEILAEATLYSSCEPCAMCAGGIYWSGLGRLVYSCSTERDARISEMPFAVPCRQILIVPGGRKLEVIGPMLEEESFEVLAGYWPRKLEEEARSFGLSV